MADSRKRSPAVAGLIYPHQLFDPHPVLPEIDLAVLVEDPLFFSQFDFHRQKLMLHRASMKCFAAKLTRAGVPVRYIESAELATSADVAKWLKKEGVVRAVWVDPSDDWLTARVSSALAAAGIPLVSLEDPHFLTPRSQIEAFVAEKKKLFFTDFYVAQRKRLKVLLEGGKPAGGKWSFDAENRKKLPTSVTVPAMPKVKVDAFATEARAYVEERFSRAPGTRENLLYPHDHAAAGRWLDDFCEMRLQRFGDYEDAISRRSPTVFHSVLTPVLNTGLLSPNEAVRAALDEAERVPLNSLEGFLRQVIGWREYVRLVYLTRGREQRTRNYWNFTRPLPKAFYDGTTGIEPVDAVIRSTLERGYCHHIERLMVLGNFMLLCGIRPNDVYRWFMELFVDAYDWVMVPNVYGMSQHADGGFMTTKPYISGSAYVLKMSDFKRGPWCDVWDALYWTFIDRHEDFFRKNPRMMVMVKMRDKLGPKLERHRQVAQSYLRDLFG